VPGSAGAGAAGYGNIGGNYAGSSLAPAYAGGGLGGGSEGAAAAAPGGGGSDWMSGFTLGAEGGVATRATPTIIGEAGTEALIPLDRLHEFTGGGNGAPQEVTLRLVIEGGVLMVNDEKAIDLLLEKLSAAVVERDGNLVAKRAYFAESVEGSLA